MPTPNHRKNQIPVEQVLRRKGRGNMSLRMAAETQERNKQYGCQKATQRISGTRALLLGCYYSCNLTGKAGSTSSQSRTFHGWPAGHVTLIVLCTHLPLPCKCEHTRECSQSTHDPLIISHWSLKFPQMPMSQCHCLCFGVWEEAFPTWLPNPGQTLPLPQGQECQ